MPPLFETLTAEGLIKLFGTTRALAGVSLSLNAGEITTIEGPNGSGKSTLLAILAQSTTPTAGSLRYGGRRRAGASLRRHIGVLAHQSMLYGDLTGRENLELVATLHGIPNREAKVSEALHRFEIGRFADRPTRTYSRGQLQRVSLARALLNAPTLLLLDEPSTGLDPHGVERLAIAARAEKKRGAIVVMVTHDPGLAERLSDRRIRMERGRVVEERRP